MTDDRQIDVREVPQAKRHPLILAAYDELGPGEALLLTNDHEPRHLREELDRELPGSFRWESRGETTAGAWQVRIVRTTRTPLPRLVADASALLAELPAGRSGSVWQLSPAARDLDANIIALPPGDEIAAHDGPDLDVLLHILAGTGTLETETGEIALAAGALVWLPRRSRRRIAAGAAGLQYFSVHHRKPALTISAAPPRTGH